MIDYLIIGSGLAGISFAEVALRNGKSIFIMDNNSQNSSKVAGGLYNPITGRKMVKTWNCDQLFDYLIPYYRDLQYRLGVNFLKNLS